MDKSKIEELTKINRVSKLEDIYEKNPYYVSNEFREKFKFAMFHILLENYATAEIQMPPSVRERSRQYLQGCDEFFSWFNENYESAKTEPRCFVSIADLFNDIKNADFYESLSRDQKRAFTKRGIVETIKEHFYLKRNYCEKYDIMIQGKRTRANNVIMDYQRREPETDPNVNVGFNY